MNALGRLAAAIGKAGKTVQMLNGPDGERIMILPHGGRVLGLFAAEGDANFLWTNPALDAAESARALFASDGWCNTGGDRTWLAPETDFFFPHYPDTSVYKQQRSLDPGNYVCHIQDESICLTNRLTIRSSRTGEELPLQITRSIFWTPNPLSQGLPGLRYAGYILCARLKALGQLRSPVGLWSLLQLPHGGQMLIPTRHPGKPRLWFGSISAADLAVDEHLICYRMRSAGEHKIGVRAVDSTGMLGYLHHGPAEWSLVLRNFRLNRSGSYVDTPYDGSNDSGYAVQVCNVSNPALGCFSEMEYHVPAILPSDGPRDCEDVSRVWAFRGSEETIRSVARLLLGESAAAEIPAVNDPASTKQSNERNGLHEQTGSH